MNRNWINLSIFLDLCAIWAHKRFQQSYAATCSIKRGSLDVRPIMFPDDIWWPSQALNFKVERLNCSFCNFLESPKTLMTSPRFGFRHSSDSSASRPFGHQGYRLFECVAISQGNKAWFRRKLHHAIGAMKSSCWWEFCWWAKHCRHSKTGSFLGRCWKELSKWQIDCTMRIRRINMTTRAWSCLRMIWNAGFLTLHGFTISLSNWHVSLFESRLWGAAGGCSPIVEGWAFQQAVDGLQKWTPHAACWESLDDVPL